MRVTAGLRPRKHKAVQGGLGPGVNPWSSHGLPALSWACPHCHCPLLPPSQGSGEVSALSTPEAPAPPPTPNPVAPGNQSWPAVEQPIPTLEGNVYFLLQIAPAAAWWLNEPFELLEAPTVGGRSQGARGWGMERLGPPHCLTVTKAGGQSY